MSANLECFDYIIGLSRTDCSECYTIPADAGTSLSNLFIDELESLRSISGLENCERGEDVFQLMSESRDEAILYFMSDIELRLQEMYKLRRNPFKGSIGRVKTTASRALTVGNWAGVRMACADVVSGVLTITNIGTLFESSGTIDLYVYNNLGELEGSYTLNTVANTHTSNPVNIELPLHADYIDNLEYFFVYVVAGQPLNNTADSTKCSLSFNTCNPYSECGVNYYSQTNKQYGWTEWLMAGAFSDSTLNDLDDCSTTTSSYMNGLTFLVELRCKVNEVLCMDELDFVANPLAMAMAHAIRYKAGELLVNKILLSPNLRRETMINTEALVAARDVWIVKYDKLAEDLTKRIDVTINDCLECRDGQEIILGGIFS